MGIWPGHRGYTLLFTRNATSIESPVDQQSVDIPEYYSHFRDVFCPKKATQLPPHRPWDCAMDLLPGESVPKGKIYPLSLPEQKAMEEYIEEALQQGYICPSTSPAASSFFFVAKKDGGLRPCIDYRSLNNITEKFRYPLPLIPAALEHLRCATIFTKLDRHSAYNLIRIREGDEWKTAFVTPTGHYECLVMPYGLVNAPSVFQDFKHEVLREYLHRFVLVYIDDILIYSRSLAEHRHHVAEVCGSSASSSKLRNAHFINHPYNSWVIILTVVAFGWTGGRWRPLRPGHNPQPSKNSNASWDSPTPTTAASYRTTVPLPIHSRTYSATSPSLCPGP